jgi:hypothetical protein
METLPNRYDNIGGCTRRHAVRIERERHAPVQHLGDGYSVTLNGTGANKVGIEKRKLSWVDWAGLVVTFASICLAAGYSANPNYHIFNPGVVLEARLKRILDKITHNKTVGQFPGHSH